MLETVLSNISKFNNFTETKHALFAETAFNKLFIVKQCTIIYKSVTCMKDFKIAYLLARMHYTASNRETIAFKESLIICAWVLNYGMFQLGCEDLLTSAAF